MELPKAIEILHIYTFEHSKEMEPDELAAHRLAIERLKEIENDRECA